MSQIKCFNIELMKGNIGTSKLLYKRLKSENKPNINDYALNRIEAFVEEDYPSDTRNQMDSSKRRELIDLIMKASSEHGIIFDPAVVEDRLFPNLLIDETAIPDNEPGAIDAGKIFRMERSFLSDDQKMYGSQMYPRMLMTNSFKKMSVRSMFIRNGKAVDPNTVPMNILMEKLNLVSDILDNLPDKKIQYVEDGKRFTVPMVQKQIQQMKDVITGVGKENAGLSYIQKVDKLNQFPSIKMDMIESMFTRDSILSVADDVLNSWATGTESERAKLRSWNNIFILRNFDALIQKHFGKLIEIKNPTANRTVAFVDYKMNIDSNNINKSWQDQSDDVAAYKEAGNVVRAIMETMPLYRYDNKTITDGNLEWSKFNNAIGFLKNIPFTNLSNMEAFYVDEFKDKKSAGKIGDLISDINHDPAKNMKKVFDVLFKGIDANGRNFFESLLSNFFIDKEYQRKAMMDALYSIYQSFYGDKNGMRLYGTMSQNKFNPSTPDYYNFMTQYMIGAYRMKFVYYRRNPKATDYEVRGYILNDRALQLTENRINSRIYNASYGIVNEFMALSRNGLTPEMKAKFGQKEAQQPSLEHTVFEPDGHNDRRSVVWFNAIPINGKLYNIVFDTKNPNILVEGSGAFKAVERLNNGKTGNPIELSEIVSEAIRNSNTDNFTTALDDIISIAYSIPLNSDLGFRRLLYEENGKFNQKNIDKLLRGALSIIAFSEINNSMLSKVSSAEELDMWLNEKNIFPFVVNDDKKKINSIMKLYNRPGINNISSNIGSAMELILDAVAYSDNVLGRDTISSPDGTQISSTQSNRLVSSNDSQFLRIKNASKNGEVAPAKSLMINCTINEFFTDLIEDGVLTTEETGLLMTGLNRNEPIFKGSYTTRLADLNAQTKKRADFNIQESVISDYVINFLNNVYGGNDVDKDIIFNTQVNADKSQVTYEAINGNFIRNLANMSEGKRMAILKNAFKNLYTDIYNSIEMTYAKMDESIMNMANPDAFNVYDRVLSVDESEMMERFMAVYASNPNYADSGLFNQTINSNFETFNDICDRAGVKAYDMAMLLSKVHNAMNPLNPIEFIDQTHFLKDKKTGHIKFNPLLVSKIIRFNPDIMNSFDMSTFGPAGFFTDFDSFYQAKNNELFFSMIDSGINISITNSNGRDNGFTGLKKLKDITPEWFSGGKMILGKLRRGDEVIDITSDNDLRAFLEGALVSAHIGNIYTVNDALRSSKSLNEWLDKMHYTIEVNPELSKFNWIDYFIGQSYEISSVGDNFNHPVKGQVNNDMELDAFATYAQIKRNVSQTTTIKPWVVDHLNSIPRVINVAPVEDISNSVSSFSGMFKNISPHDGISFMSPTAVYLFNNGLMDSRVGFDMKPFFHDYNISTSTGAIIKTSTDALTNQTIKQGKNMKTMAKKMMNARWMDKNGQPINGDIFKDYGFRMFDNKWNRVNLFGYISNKYHPMVELSKGNVYEIVDIQKVGNDEDETPLYVRTMKLVDRLGDYNEDSETVVDEVPVRVGSNYDLWNLFGAENSKEKNPETGLISDSENSIKAIVDMINNNGLSNNNEQIEANQSRSIESQADVYQFMKHGNADIVASHGAMKQGYTNVNRFQDFYFNKKGMLNTMKFDLTHSGVVLDPTHKADNSTISELTQVVNALSSRGFTKWKSSQIYDALASITVASMMDLVENTKGTIENPNYNDLAANLIVRAMAEQKAFSDKAREDCADLISRVSHKGFVTYEELRQRLDIGSNSFIIGAIPVIASYINKISIKKTNAGTLALMKASSGIVQIHGNKLYGEIGVNNEEKFSYLMNLENESRPLYHPSDTDMGHIYKIAATAEEATELQSNPLFKDSIENVVFSDGHLYFNLKDMIVYDALKHFYNTKGGREIFETYIRPVTGKEEADLTNDGIGYMALGRELAPINYHFLLDGENTNLYDIKAVELMRRARNRENVDGEINAILLANYGFELPVTMSTFDKAMVLYQKELNNISNANNGGAGWVSSIDENGNVIRRRINGRVNIKYYEAVAPNVNKTSLGITDDVNVADINKDYFAKRFIPGFGLKVDPEHYTYALLKSSGRHVYVYDTSSDISKPFEPAFGMDVVDIDRTIDASGHLYRKDKNGKVLYEITPNDVIYRKKDGTEIIVTNRPSVVIGSLGFRGLKISPAVYKNANVDEIVQNRANVDAIITTMFRSASAYFKDGEKVEGSGSQSAYYWTSDEHGHNPYIDDILEIAYNDYISLRDNLGVDTSNTYMNDELLKEIEDGKIEDFKNSKSPYKRYIYRNATELYNSFKASLNSIVARTPSQTMQSFMPMTIVAFDKSGNNSCYVSDMQVWLQGSDFDGDKTNFQEYDLDQRGRFVGWSPLFRLDNINESLRIPFPTSRGIVKISEFENDNTQQIYDAAFNRIFKKNDKGVYELLNDFDIESLVQFLSIINSDSDVLDEGTLRIPTGTKISELDKVKEAVDKHNLYMTNMDRTRMKGTKNFITYMSMSISEDPANLYESQSSVDDMSDISELGKKDEGSKERLKMSSANFILKYDALVNNIVGKNVISVVASGMKTFFNIANFYNTLTEGDRKRFLLGRDGNGITILGKTYNFVANWNPTESVRNKLREIVVAETGKQASDIADNANLITEIDALLNGSQSEKNAGLILSALLSEATDNAKNLNLAKINANDAMAPFYIYGITIGMDIEDIGRIMMSDTARLYSKMKNGNIFYGEVGPKDIQQFKKDYIEVFHGKKVNDFGLNKLPELARNRIKSSDIFNEMLERGFISRKTPDGYAPTSEDYFALDNVRKQAIHGVNLSEATNDDKDRAIAAINNYINKVKGILYIRRTVNSDVVNVNGKNMDIIDALIELEKGRNEMQIVSKIVGLNKGVKTTRDEQISFINSIRGIFSRKVDEDSRKLVDDFLKIYSDNPYSDISGFDMKRFINDSDYRMRAMDIYENIFKHSFNVLDIAYSLPLIRNYIKVSNISNGITTGISVKNKAIDWLSEKAIQDLGYLNQKERMSVIKHVSMYVNSSLFNRFMQQIDGNEFYLPVNSEFYNSDIELKPVDSPTKETLGTRRGNANFMKWMNEYVIPNMKNGIYDETGKTDRRVVNNKFINSLGMVTIDRTLSGALLNVYAPSIDKRSNNQHDVMMSTVLTNSAKKLDSAMYVDSNGVRHNISDLLYIYNQIAFNGNNTQYSMDEFISNDSNLKKRYSDFENEVLTEESITSLIPYDYEEGFDPGVLMYLAPESNTNVSNSKFIRSYNQKDMKTQFYEIVKDAQEDDNGMDYDDTYGGLTEVLDYQQDNGFNDELNSMFDNYDGYNSSRFSLKKNASDEYDNFIYTGSSSMDIVKNAMSYNRLTSNEKLNGKVFNLVDENIQVGDTRFKSYPETLYAIRSNGNPDVDTLYDMIQDVNNSTTGVIKLSDISGNEFFVLKSNNARVAFISKNSNELYYISNDGAIQYASPKDYSGFGFEGFVGNNNFDSVRKLIDNIENEKSCTL